MAIQTQTKAAPFGAISVFRGAQAVDNIANTFRSWNEARRTMNELYQLTDRELNDLGIARGEIREIAKRASR